MPQYSLSQFEKEIENLKPRVFDTYILPGFLIYFAVKAKMPMKRNARRILFVSGVYMFYRNYSEYKKLAAVLKERVAALIPEGENETVAL